MAFGIGWLKAKLGQGKQASEGQSCPECDAEINDKQLHCEVCGYDLVRQTKDETGGFRGPM